MKRYKAILKEQDPKEEKYWLSIWHKFQDNYKSIDDFDTIDSESFECTIKVSLDDIKNMLKYDSLFGHPKYSINDIKKMNDKELLSNFWKVLQEDEIKRIKSMFNKEYDFYHEYEVDVNYHYDKSKKEFTYIVIMLS